MNGEDFRIEPASTVRLDGLDPAATPGFAGKADAAAKLKSDIKALCALQDRLNAQAESGVLVVLQGMDTAGKDGVVKHVMTGVNPAGVNVYSFKKPSEEEERHDYLWRTSRDLPARGSISIFNRSYFENVLVTRVHPELLHALQKDARERGDAFWNERFADINAFESYLGHNGIEVIKLFLNVSKAEQRRRLEARLNDGTKQWKFSSADLQERGFWDAYMHAYEEMLSHTSTAHAPWYAVPADHKWFARLAVADILVRRLGKMNPQYPVLSPDMHEQIERAKAAIAAETA